MRYNFLFFWSKFVKKIQSPSLRACNIDKSARVGSASNCINVNMGRYSYMGNNNSVTNTDIGAFCSIASNCAIGGGAHPVSSVSTSPVFYSGKNILHKNFGNGIVEINKKVIIGNDVWIGEAVFICDGIVIEDGAIVGAHSVVTHNVPAYSIVAGAPARVIRHRFDETTIQKLHESKWWEWPEEKLTEMGIYFESPVEFLRAVEGK